MIEKQVQNEWVDWIRGEHFFLNFFNVRDPTRITLRWSLEDFKKRSSAHPARSVCNSLLINHRYGQRKTFAINNSPKLMQVCLETLDFLADNAAEPLNKRYLPPSLMNFLPAAVLLSVLTQEEAYLPFTNYSLNIWAVLKQKIYSNKLIVRFRFRCSDGVRSCRTPWDSVRQCLPDSFVHSTSRLRKCFPRSNGARYRTILSRSSQIFK